ncbi:LysR family transcriptional regulator [Methylobacterium oryzihabitans]|uniref:LysR family transcriptional regulator n=1 Tax=Methylobacterium oryzihabitans TaxID=2499852 RepID=A0A437PGG6_9HYPH|nr:LysR family transcriptional regulator [Methylobacterium oryzihabitans]RVU21214.1 LysR family transcriptional regulator [Methylobacterium oryzihabitans]
MDLLEIRYFLEVAAVGSLSRAAVRLGVSQPALSRQIGKLETELRGPLFYRHGRGVTLTAAGRRFLDVGQSVIQQLSDLREELAAGTLDVSGEITLGIPPSLAASLGADLALRFAAEFPKARLRIREAFSAILLEWTEAQRIDVAVLYDARSSPSLITTPLLLEDLFLVERPAADGDDHDDPVMLSELAGRECVLPGPENGLRRVLDSACASEGIRPHVVTEVDCVAALKQLVERGVGATVLPFGSVHREVKDGKLRVRPFASPAMRALLVIATPSNKPVTPLVRAVVRIIEDAVETSVPLDVLRGVTRKADGRALRSPK